MKVLAIGAHYDDIEIGCGGSLLKHRNNNDDISLLIVSKSNYSDQNHIRTELMAKGEGKINSEKLNAKLLHGNFETLQLKANSELIFYICKVVNDIKPDIVYTHFYGDQHLDHEAISKSSLIACRNVKKLLMYMSNVYQTTISFDPNYYNDISDVHDEKIELIETFKSEGTKIQKWIDQINSTNRIYGIKNSKDYCEGFVVSRILEE